MIGRVIEKPKKLFKAVLGWNKKHLEQAKITPFAKKKVEKKAEEGR